MGRLLRLRRVAAVAVVLLALGMVALTAYLRRDTTAVFYRVRGSTPAPGCSTSGSSARPVPWIELRNDRGEAVATAYVRSPRSLPPRPRVLLTYAGEKTGRQMLRAHSTAA